MKILIILIVALIIFIIPKEAGQRLEARKATQLILAIRNKKDLIVEPAQVLAIIKIESNFYADAVNPADPSYGLMQIMPALAAAYGARTEGWKTDPESNMTIGMKFLSDLNRKYANIFDNAERYNLGETKYAEGKRAPGYRDRFTKWYWYYKKLV